MAAQCGGRTQQISRPLYRSTAHALKTFQCRRALGTRVNPDTIGYVRTGEFDLNTLRVDGEIFESGEKKLRIQKYPDTCGRGLSAAAAIYSCHSNWSVIGRKLLAGPIVNAIHFTPS